MIRPGAIRCTSEIISRALGRLQRKTSRASYRLVSYEIGKYSVCQKAKSTEESQRHRLPDYLSSG